MINVQAQNKVKKLGRMEKHHDDAEVILGFRRCLSHPLNATTQKAQQNAKHVNATATLRNIIISSRPLLIAANVTSSVLSMNIKPPHARKKLPRASVGGREGKMDFGGLIHKKKYVRHLSTENPSKSHPHNWWIWTWKTYACAWALIAAPVTPMTRAGKGLKLAR